jgi:uncharacterized coiled-coil protein SlyX
MDPLQLLNEKIDILLRRYAALQAENIRLKETVAEQLRAIEQLNGNLAALEEKMLGMQISTGLQDEEEKQELRRRLDKLIAEIDKMLISLND